MTGRARSRAGPRIAARALAVVLAALAAGLPARPGSARPSLDSLVQQVRQGDCAGALTPLQTEAAGGGLAAQRAAYLLGVCLTRLNRDRDAAAAFAAAADHPTLRPWARLEQGIALIRSGSAADAATLLMTAARDVPRTTTPAAGRLRARLLLALGDAEVTRSRPAAALGALTEAAALRPDDPKVWMSLGAAAAAAGRGDVARRALSRAAWGFPGHPAEPAARDALARVLGRPPRPSDADAEARLARGRRLVNEGAWDQAAVEFRAAAVAVASGPVAGEAWHRLGALLLQSDPSAAYRAFHRAAALGWNPAASWFWAEHAARLAGMPSRAREALQTLMRVAPGSTWAARLLYNAGLRAEGSGRLTEAVAHYRRATEVAPASDDAPEARWRMGWIALRTGRLADAEARFRAAAQTAPWRSAAARAWYWTAKTLETSADQRNTGEAARIIRMVAEQYPMTFYGQRARTRLGLAPAAPPPESERAVPRGAAGSAHEELAGLGLDADAADAVEDAIAARPDPRLSRVAAEVYARLGDIPRSVALAEDALAGGVRDVGTWRLAYPKAYWPDVSAAAQAAGIDPLLLLALVREESRYDAAAISPARAVGLAQVLPTTAQALSGDASLDARRLRDPRINLRLGARYLKLQLDRFGGDPRLALAAYNAGPGAARRWVGLDPDPDYFIERIGYTETRAYIRRVIGSYGVYKVLW